jgi:hypothetical protein
VSSGFYQVTKVSELRMNLRAYLVEAFLSGTRTVTIKDLQNQKKNTENEHISYSQIIVLNVSVGL